MAGSCTRTDTGLQQKVSGALVLGLGRWSAPLPRRLLGIGRQENASRGTVVAQSQGVNPVALVLWKYSWRGPIDRMSEWGSYTANSSSNAFASFRSKRVKALSEPAVDRSEQFARLRLALIASPSQRRHAAPGTKVAKTKVIVGPIEDEDHLASREPSRRP